MIVEAGTRTRDQRATFVELTARSMPEENFGFVRDPAEIDILTVDGTREIAMADRESRLQAEAVQLVAKRVEFFLL